MTDLTVLLIFAGMLALVLASYRALRTWHEDYIRAAKVLGHIGLSLLVLALACLVVAHVTPLLDAWTAGLTDPLGGVR
jgi:multisubunit Na+/H+ antiporter MnhB subunit